MSGGHTHLLHVHGDSVVHRLPAQTKLVALVLTVLAVVAAPREQFWAFAAFGLLVAVLVLLAGLRVGTVLRRMTIELPIVCFALLLPFVARGPRTEVLGVGVSVNGVWGAWEVLATATLGVACSVVLAATTPLRDLIGGLERLRLPTLMVQIMTFMLRYADLVLDDLRRMRIARESRGFDARGVRQWPVLARTAGALFLRCFERGERVHLAMLARGYDGRLSTGGAGAAPGQWALALCLPLVACSICALAWVGRGLG